MGVGGPVPVKKMCLYESWGSFKKNKAGGGGGS